MKSRVDENVAVGDVRATKALLRRLHSTYISDDNDEVNDKLAEAANRELIRRRKTRRNIERKKADAEAKDIVMTLSESIPNNRKLSNHHDFHAVLIFLMDIENMVQRKVWTSPTELRVFRLIKKGSKAHTACFPQSH
jgi:transcription initiation factor TFIIIB Brf1 subunit/transcription initiation factor TFIIB